MLQALELISNNLVIKIISITIIFDTIFGCIRAIGAKTLNSSFGINGILRKAGILVACTMFFFIDEVLKINLLPFVNQDMFKYLGTSSVGITEFFGALFICFECLSILHNIYMIGLPLPKNVVSYMENWLKEHSDIKPKK